MRESTNIARAAMLLGLILLIAIPATAEQPFNEVDNEFDPTLPTTPNLIFLPNLVSRAKPSESELKHAAIKRLIKRYGWTRDKAEAAVELVDCLADGVDTTEDLNHLVDAIKAFDNTIEVQYVGGKKWNAGAVGIGSQPSRNAAEGITNAVDAVLHLAVLKNSAFDTKSPSEAAALLDIAKGDISEMDDKQVREAVEKHPIEVAYRDSGFKKKPTLTISDSGCGQPPSRIGDTMMAFHAGHKATKAWQIGEHGQGWREMLNHCQGAVVVSRAHPSHISHLEANDEHLGEHPDWVAVTALIKVREDENSPLNYIYFGRSDGSVAALPPEMFIRAHGSEFRFIEYDARGTYNYTTAGSNCLYANAEALLAGTPMPFVISSDRDTEKNRGRRYIRGLKHKLGRFVKTKQPQIKYAESTSIPIGHGQVVTYAYLVSNASFYVKANDQVLFTHTGQLHGTLPRRWLKKEIKKPFIYKNVLVIVELDSLKRADRDNILSSTREGLIDSEITDSVKDAVAKCLRDDPGLEKANEEAKMAALNQQNEQVSDTVLDIVKKKIRTQRNKRKVMKWVEVIVPRLPNGGGGISVPRSTADDHLSVEPSALNFLKPSIKIHRGRSPWVTVEIDAKNEYLPNHDANLEIGWAGSDDPPRVDARKSLKGGKASWKIATDTSTNLGEYTLNAKLQTANGLLEDSMQVIVVAGKPNGRTALRRQEVEEDDLDLNIRWQKGDFFDEHASGDDDVGWVSEDKQTIIFLNKDHTEFRRFVGLDGLLQNVLSDGQRQHRRNRYAIGVSVALFGEEVQSRDIDSPSDEWRASSRRNIAQGVMVAIDHSWDDEEAIALDAA